MAIKKYKPTSPGRRGMTGIDYRKLTKKKPEKALLSPKTRKAGRGSEGKITTRHKGGGAKKRYRIIDFKRDKFDIPAKIAAVEYDPNRSAFIALAIYADGEKRYILAFHNIKVGDKIIASRKENTEIKVGNRLCLKHILPGTSVYNIEMIPGKGGQIVRSAGSSAVVSVVEGGFAQVNLPSGEVRKIPEEAMATIGQVSNVEHSMVVIGKAGRSRWMGKRPTVRGSAMNPVDHPHGGGEGRQPIGLKYPKTPWGKPALGKKTRKKNKPSNKYIIKGRKKKKR